MSRTTVTMVRIYLTEGEGSAREIFRYLHDEAGVRGVTLFRGIAGFGKSGRIHSADLLDLSLDLPIVVEFFDEPGKVERIVEDLNEVVEPGHLVRWKAYVEDP